MVLPRLIHPVDVKVERLIRSELVMDNDAREPFHGPRTTTAESYTIKAQVKWSAKDDLDPSGGGSLERSVGYILVRLVDMDSILGVGVRLKRGDRITEIGVQTGLDLYIVKEAPAGHYPDQSGQSLIKYHFEDRHPVQQVGDL